MAERSAQDSPEPTASDDRREVRAVRDISPDEVRDLVEEVATEAEYSLSERQPREREWEKWHRLYRGKPHFDQKDYPYRGGSNVVVPIAGEDVERMRARIMQTVFGVEPLYVVSQRNKKFGAFAKPLERYMDAIRSDVFDLYQTTDDMVLETLKLGTSGAYQDWVDDTTWRYDETLEMTVPAGRVVGPAPVWKPLEDILMPEGYADHQRSPWVAVRNWYSLSRLRELEFRRAVQNVDALVGHEDQETQLRKMRRATLGGDQSAGPAMADGKRSERKERGYGIFSPWTVFFRRDLDGDGYPEEYVMMLHLSTRTLLRFKPNPYPSSMRPLVVARFIPIEGEFYGIGIPEMVEHQQEEASTIHNERRDNAHLANIRMYKARMTSSVGDTIRPESGKVIKLVDTKDLEEFALTDRRQTDIYEEDVVVKQSQRRVGTNDLAQGQMSSPLGRAAATTVMALVQEGSQLFDMNITAIRRAISEQGLQILELYQTHGVPDPMEPGSPEQFLDDGEAALVRQLLTEQDNLRGIVKVKLNASTSAVNRATEQQANVQLYGIVTNYMQQMLALGMQIASPMVAPELKVAMVRSFKGLDETMRLVIQSFNRFDLEAVLSADLVQQLAVQSIQTQVMMAAGGMPIGTTGTPEESAGAEPGGLPSPPNQGAAVGQSGSGPQGGPLEQPGNGAPPLPV